MRLLNTDLFGKTVDDPIVTLSKAEKGAIYPESVFLDVDDNGVYYASTVRYPLAPHAGRCQEALEQDVWKVGEGGFR